MSERPEPPQAALSDIAPAFVEMAHRIVWATVATVDPHRRPRTRILHPIWEWNGGELTGWIATAPTPVKRAHLDKNPQVSLAYWDPSHDTCNAECRATWMFDEKSRQRVWDLFANGPAPVGYDPAIVPVWADGPTSEAFAVLRLDPWRLRVFPGTVLLRGEGTVMNWHS